MYGRERNSILACSWCTFVLGRSIDPRRARDRSGLGSEGRKGLCPARGSFFGAWALDLGCPPRHAVASGVAFLCYTVFFVVPVSPSCSLTAIYVLTRVKESTGVVGCSTTRLVLKNKRYTVVEYILT